MTVQHAKILKAWCVDLNAEITITDARREYTNQEPPPPRYTFYCNDVACLRLPEKVRVSGVNYTTVAEESSKYKAAHFRLLDKHHPDCAWLYEPNMQQGSKGTRQATAQRDAKRKLTDLVTIFDPRPKHSKSGNAALSSDNDKKAQTDNSGSAENRPRIPKEEQDRAGETKTSDLDRLVDSYIEAKNGLTRAEFQALRLKIEGHGEYSYDEYFQWIGRTDGSGVMYGGGWVEVRGYGFKIFFFDKRSGKPIGLYVSAEQLKNFKYQRHLKKSVDEVVKSGKKKYLKAYCMGRIEAPGRFDSWNIVVDNLNHLVLRVTSKENLD